MEKRLRENPFPWAYLHSHKIHFSQKIRFSPIHNPSPFFFFVPFVVKEGFGSIFSPCQSAFIRGQFFVFFVPCLPFSVLCPLPSILCLPPPCLLPTVPGFLFPCPLNPELLNFFLKPQGTLFMLEIREHGIETAARL